jgi:hypothetical protein
MKRLAMALAALTAAGWAAASGSAHAEVTDRSAAGFEVVEKATVAASGGKVWEALMRPARWWSSQHTFSGDAKNLYIDPAGCFCERLKKGAVRHMDIVYADGGTTLRFAGAIGPLQTTGAMGHLAFVLKPNGETTDITLSYDVGGYGKGGLAEEYATPVDRVLGEQLARLKKYLETGKPD